jgi:predicted outer membrane protein
MKKIYACKFARRMLQDKQNTKRPVNDGARNKGVVAHGKIVVAFHRFSRLVSRFTKKLRKTAAQKTYAKLHTNSCYTPLKNY